MIILACNVLFWPHGFCFSTWGRLYLLHFLSSRQAWPFFGQVSRRVKDTDFSNILINMLTAKHRYEYMIKLCLCKIDIFSREF